MLEAQRRDEANQRVLYGDVRPIIHADFNGHKVVAVGNRVHYSKGWRTFADFLFDYIKTTLGEEWGTAELKKPPDAQHPIIQWYGCLCRLRARTKQDRGPDVDGLYVSELDGPSKAYVLLAYDLYVLRHNQLLQQEVVHRLKHRVQFQGARYELFVAATMVRAGFDIQFEDEADGTRKHPEFRAVHRRTGQVVAVEAKSRHASGVLGSPIREGRSPLWMAFRRLLGRALEKPTDAPLIVFIDANLPPEAASPLAAHPWHVEVDRAVAEVDRGVSKTGVYTGSPFALLVVTNAVDHQGAEGGPPPQYVYYRTRPATSARPLQHLSVLDAIERSLRQYGNVPTTFPEQLTGESLPVLRTTCPWVG